MPRQKKKPSYSLHKPTGQAYARLNGKVVYLGKYGTPEFRNKYDESRSISRSAESVAASSGSSAAASTA